MKITKPSLVAKKHFFTIAFISWMVFITFSSLYSFEDVSVPKMKIPHLDKAVHFTFYFVACVLGIFFLRERSRGEMSFRKALLIMLVSTIAFGIFIEVLQHALTSNRQGDYLDGIANSVGSLCGAWASKVYFSGKRQLKWKY